MGDHKEPTPPPNERAAAQQEDPLRMPTLGDWAQDTITGFEGRVVGRVEYVTGCRQFLLAPAAKEDGTLNDGRWFDEDRVHVRTTRAPLTLTTRPGAWGGIARVGSGGGADLPAPLK